MEYPEIRSILEKGWLAECKKTEQFAEELISNIPKYKILSLEENEQRLYCYALYVRAFTSFQGMWRIMEFGLLIESATLARSCIENAIYMKALCDDVAMLKDLKLDDNASTNGRLKDVIKTAARICPTEDKIKELSNQQETFAALKGKKLKVKEVSERASLDVLHTYFKHLSAVAVHPSLTAIAASYKIAKNAVTYGEMKDEYARGLMIITLTSSFAALGLCMATMMDMNPDLSNPTRLAEMMSEVERLNNL